MGSSSIPILTLINNKTIKIRLLVSLLSNIVRSILNFVTILLLARSLNSSGYGHLMFLMGSFISIRSLMDLGTSNAFFTFISQGNNRSSHYVTYFVWLLLQLTLFSLFILLICPTNLLNIIWLGHSRYLIFLAFMASFLQQQGWQTINQIGESERKTVWNQVFGVSIAAINLLGIALLQMFNLLSLTSILTYYIIEYAILFSIAFFVLDANQYLFCTNTTILKIKDSIKEYAKYCYPLVVTTLIGFLYTYVDTWMLQYFGGAAQQGLFQVANQFAMVSLLAINSVLNIFWKEIATAHKEQDSAKVERIYFKAMRGMILFGAAISGFLLPWTSQIIQLLLGQTYSEAVPILTIMFFYPIHQSIGQLTGAFFLATNQTRIYSITSIIVMLMSMPVTYFVQAPASGYIIAGLGLGAMGLALKTVLINMVSVNISVYIIARLQKWNYDFLYQFYTVASACLLGYFSYWASQAIGGNINLLLQGLIAAVIYVISMIFLIFNMPAIAGMSHMEIQDIKDFVLFRAHKYGK